MIKISKISRYVSIVLVCGMALTLVACSDLETIDNTILRDRTYDYARYPVKASKPLILPSDVQVRYAPTNRLPKGPNDYLPVGTVNIGPPAINEPTLIVSPYQAYMMRQAAINKKLKDLQQQLKQLQKQQPKNGMTGTTMDMPAPVSKTTVASTSTATTKTMLTPAPLDKTGNTEIPMLNVKSTFDAAWKNIGVALPKLGYKIVKTDKGNGYYYIAPKGETSTHNTILLYLYKSGEHVSVILYDVNGNPSKDPAAAHFIDQLAKMIAK